jgi:hypothetical protein
MINRILIVTICIVYFILNKELKAQIGFCTTPADFDNILPSQNQNLSLSENIRIRIYIHIIRNSNGTGGISNSSILSAITRLKNDLEPHKLCISLSGIGFIDNDFFSSNFNDSKFNSLINTNNKYNAINIYVLPNEVWNQGKASGIPGRSLVLGGSLFGVNLFDSHVLAHEFGHCLGLYHTFRGSPSEPYGCREFVNGSNCANCGDFVCDTPADPGLDFNVNDITCLWNATGFDQNGDPYAPDTRNIMAYTKPNCMSYFSTGQGIRMYNTLLNAQILQSCIIPDSELISPVLLASNQRIFYNLKKTLELSNVYSEGELIAEAGTKVSIKSSSNIKGSFRGRIKYDCSITEDINSGRHAVSLIESPNNFKDFIADGSTSSYFNLYPNPAYTKLTLDFENSISGILLLEIVDLVGRVHSSKSYTLDNLNPQIIADVSNLGPGVYFLKINSKDGSSTKRFIKK